MGMRLYCEAFLPSELSVTQWKARCHSEGTGAVKSRGDLFEEQCMTVTCWDINCLLGLWTVLLCFTDHVFFQGFGSGMRHQNSIFGSE